MGWNGSGTFNRSDGTRSGTQVWQDADAAGIKIRADDHDTHDQDIADGLENTVTLDGQNTTTTDNAILRYDSGNTQFEGVSISASQLIGRSATGDTRGMSAATARQTIGIGTAATTNNTILQYSSANSQYIEYNGFGTASPANNQALFFTSASSTYEQKSAVTARSLLGLPDFATAVGTNNQAIFWASSSSQYESKSAATARSLIGIATAAPANDEALFFSSASNKYVQVGALKNPGISGTLSLAFNTWRTPSNSRPTLVETELVVFTDGTSDGAIDIEVDESGGTAKDYSLRASCPAGAGNGQAVRHPVCFFVPAGGSYQLQNSSDPDNQNAAEQPREFNL